jgi:small subunit ribosomal protein S15
LFNFYVYFHHCRPVTFKIDSEVFDRVYMARIHAHTHGKSHSVRPASKNTPSWIKQSQEEISSLVVQLSNAGLTPSEIGIRIRDEHGIPLIKSVL